MATLRVSICCGATLEITRRQALLGYIRSSSKLRRKAITCVAPTYLLVIVRSAGITGNAYSDW